MNLGPCAFWNDRAERAPQRSNETKQQPCVAAPPRKAARALSAGGVRRQTAARTGFQAKRIKALLALTTLLLAAGVAGWRVWVGLAPADATPAVTVPMAVQPGDTLWSLARRFGDPGLNIRDRVDTLARANGLPAGTALYPGQRLVVPVRNPSEVAKLRREVASAPGAAAVRQ